MLKVYPPQFFTNLEIFQSQPICPTITRRVRIPHIISITYYRGKTSAENFYVILCTTSTSDRREPCFAKKCQL